jgi:SAM-dependent methyltransferase
MTTTNSLNSKAADFNNWVREFLFKPEHRIGTTALEQAVDAHLISLYRELKLHSLLKEHSSPKSLAQALGYSDSAWIALNALLRRLSDRHDFVTYSDQSEITECKQFKPVYEPEDMAHELPEHYRTMETLGPDYIAPLEFLEFGRTHFIRALRDDHEFMDRVLTGQEKEHNETWDRATNTDPLQDIHGVMGAKAVEMLFDGGCILEVGGGTGNGMRNNLDALVNANRAASVEKYVFTDVSMPFILNTRRSLQSRYPDINCDWRLLNINKDWAKQRIEAHSVSLVYGVNAAHIGMHTVEFLQECKRVLKPGGHIVFSERLRRFDGDMAPREIVLNLSTYHRTAAIRHAEYRPAHAYLSAQNWSRAFELAGFSDCQVWPEAESSSSYFPEQYASVIVACV